jgi:predicted RNA-binding Zn ribbon-like protein
MSSRLVDGVPLPLPVSGHPALEFCNTRAGWGAATPKEYLTSPRALALWCREQGLITAAQAAAVAERSGGAAVLDRAVALRDAVYRCALGHAGPGDWDLLSREATRARAASSLVPGPGPTPAAEVAAATWQLDAEVAGAELGLYAAAEAAADLVTGPLAGTVAACPGEGCGWLFSDPRRRRRWCSMAVCGNRAKARRYRSAMSSAGTAGQYP